MAVLVWGCENKLIYGLKIYNRTFEKPIAGIADNIHNLARRERVWIVG
jgi:hypothetical protein